MLRYEGLRSWASCGWEGWPSALPSDFFSPLPGFAPPVTFAFLGLKTKQLYWFLCRHCDENGLVKVNLHELAEKLGASRRLVQYHLRRLINVRLVKVLDEGGGRGHCKTLALTLIPQKPKEKPSLRRPQKKVPAAQTGKEAWRRKVMMKARLIVEESALPSLQAKALLNLIGIGLFRRRWPYTVAHVVIMHLEAICECQCSDRTIRGIYAFYATKIQAHVQAGWEQIRTWKLVRSVTKIRVEWEGKMEEKPPAFIFRKIEIPEPPVLPRPIDFEIAKEEIKQEETFVIPKIPNPPLRPRFDPDLFSRPLYKPPRLPGEEEPQIWVPTVPPPPVLPDEMGNNGGDHPAEKRRAT